MRPIQTLGINLTEGQAERLAKETKGTVTGYAGQQGNNFRVVRRKQKRKSNTLDSLRWDMELEFMQGNCTRIEAWIVQSMLITMFRKMGVI